MEVSCAFPTALDSPDNIALAEQLGYARAWVYDTPQQSPDVWMTLALAAERTERIGLGPGVLVPSLRHPMVNASATATLAALAPGRVAISFGTGFTGRRAMGYGAITWAYMESYIRAYRGLPLVEHSAPHEVGHPRVLAQELGQLEGHVEPVAELLGDLVALGPQRPDQDGHVDGPGGGVTVGMQHLHLRGRRGRDLGGRCPPQPRHPGGRGWPDPGRDPDRHRGVRLHARR